MKNESATGTMADPVVSALEVLAKRGLRLRDTWHFEWPESVHQAVCRLRFTSSGMKSHAEGSQRAGDAVAPMVTPPRAGTSDSDASAGVTEGDRVPSLVAIVGGASSGKSTVFNNLLDGHLVSRISARGHTTRGPILVVHERRRRLLEQFLDLDALLPGLRHTVVELDDNVVGEPGALTVAFHPIAAFADVFLFDLPDFSSEGALQEGDIAMALLPWFDRLVVIVDHERWFDRQSVSSLRAQSARLGQQRWVLFNRTLEGGLRDEDREVLAQQAQRLGAEGMGVLDFRRGRGFRHLPPGSLDELRAFLARRPPDRIRHLIAFVSQAANRLLNQNEERTARLEELRGSLDAAVERGLPSARDCLTGLTTPSERRELDFVSRVLRIRGTRQWVADRTRRIHDALKRVPILGAAIRAPSPTGREGPETTDRRAIATAYFEAVVTRHVNEIELITRSCGFWEEVRRWTGLKPARCEFTLSPSLEEDVRSAAGSLDVALSAWITKVEAECRGVSPHVKGAIGVGTVALALVLIAVPGPVTLLTLATAKGAIGAALAQLATAAGAGALLGKPIGRLISVAQEKLLGSPEFHAVQEATGAFRLLLESCLRRLAADSVSEAGELVMANDEPLAKALECLREPPETSP